MLKRDEVKYIRDLAKKAYKKDTKCYICGTEEELQFHHFYSVSLLWNKWKREQKIIIKTVEDILEHREYFKTEHYKELYEETITLCKFHHMDRLHKVYGKTPPLLTAEKQKRWCDKQRDKHNDAKAPTA
jgi:hypothetical protein